MNLHPPRIANRISITLVVLVMCVFGFAKFDLLQRLQPSEQAHFVTKTFFSEMSAEELAADPLESVDRFDEIEELYLFKPIALQLRRTDLLNSQPLKFNYKKRIAHCSARDPPTFTSFS